MSAESFIVKVAKAVGGFFTEKGRRSLFRTAAYLYILRKGFSLTGFERLEEAMIVEEEAAADEASAKAQMRLAEAAERQAVAAVKLAEATTMTVEAETKRITAAASARLKNAEATSKVMRARADAVAKLLAAVSKLRQHGGDLAIITSEVSALLQEGAAENPDDEIITEALEGEKAPEEEASA